MIWMIEILLTSLFNLFTKGVQNKRNATTIMIMKTINRASLVLIVESKSVLVEVSSVLTNVRKATYKNRNCIQYRSLNCYEFNKASFKLLTFAERTTNVEEFEVLDVVFVAFTTVGVFEGVVVALVLVLPY